MEELTYGSGGAARTPEEIWDEWYAPFFTYVHDNADVIRAVAYINVDWLSQPMWRADLAVGLSWGDSRVEVNDTIRALWLEEIETDFWLHDSPSLFGKPGYPE